MLLLDPVDVLLTAPPFPEGQARFARWCQELSRESHRLASELDVADRTIQLERSMPEPEDLRHDERSVAGVYQFPGGQPYAVEVRPGANVSINVQPGGGATSISFRKRDRMSLTIVLPEDVAQQLLALATAAPRRTAPDDSESEGSG
jgi:hypothetical protein